MQPDDDTPPPRPRWLGWALIAFGLLVALGMLNLGVRMVLSAKPAQADAPQQPTSTAPVAGFDEVPPTSSLVGQALVQASDCLRCHGMDRRYVGPSFRQIADRYREQPRCRQLPGPQDPRRECGCVGAYRDATPSPSQ